MLCDGVGDVCLLVLCLLACLASVLVFGCSIMGVWGGALAGFMCFLLGIYVIVRHKVVRCCVVFVIACTCSIGEFVSEGGSADGYMLEGGLGGSVFRSRFHCVLRLLSVILGIIHL
jgi:hypothetical protein